MPESEDGRMAKRVVHISQLTEDGVYVMALESGDRVLACVASSEWLRDKDGVQMPASSPSHRTCMTLLRSS